MANFEISALIRQIIDLDPKSLAESKKVRGELIRVRDVMDRQGQNGVADFLDATSTLLKHVSKLPLTDAQEVHNIALRLLRLIEKGFQENELTISLDPTPEPEAEPEVGDLLNELQLGGLLFKLGMVERETIEEALKLQRQSNCRLGEALVQMDALETEDVESAIRLQSCLMAAQPVNLPGQQEERPVAAEMPLGEYLVQIGRISRPQLDHALQIQRATGKRLGEALVEIRAVLWRDVREAVRAQQGLEEPEEINLD